MVENRRAELFKLSNQLIDVYVRDVFSKNQANLDDLKAKITDEQRENIRKTVNHLREEVESFLYKNDATKTVTEGSEDIQPQTSPLRAKVLKERQNNAEDDNKNT